MEAPIIIKTAKEDNVGIVANTGGLKKGSVLSEGIILSDDIPAGHKVALTVVPEGGKIIRYGQVIGYAVSKIMPGEWVHESKMSLPDPPGLDSILLNIKSQPQSQPQPQPQPLTGYSFYGYRNPDGTTGTKNILGITISVHCVAGFTKYIVKKIKE